MKKSMTKGARKDKVMLKLLPILLLALVLALSAVLSIATPALAEEDASSGGGSTTYYTITVTLGAGGSIQYNGGTISPPGGTVSVKEDSDSKTFMITPSSGYIIANVKVDGISNGTVDSYKFSNVHATHTLNVSFDGGWNRSFKYFDNNGVGNPEDAY